MDDYQPAPQTPGRIEIPGDSARRHNNQRCFRRCRSNKRADQLARKEVMMGEHDRMPACGNYQARERRAHPRRDNNVRIEVPDQSARLNSVGGDGSRSK
jgi:hypothetical protein